MNLYFVKNIHFTKLVKTGDRVREFNFRMLPGTDNQLFHVDVPDDRGNRIIFRMQKADNGHWRIVDAALPAWIQNYETQLTGHIEQELT